MIDFAQRKFTSLGGVTLAADVGGAPSAPTVILLHGGGQTRHSWAGAMRQLIAEGYRVVNYDARGHGDSDWAPEGDYSLVALAGDLGSIVAQIDGPVALVGASMGGMTSFYSVGKSIVKSAKALVLVDIVMRTATTGTTRIHKFMTMHADGFATLDEAVVAVSAFNPDRTSTDPNGLRKNLRLADDGRLYWHWDPRLVAVKPPAEPPSWTNDLLEASKHIDIPTLLVRGEQSDIVDDEGVAEMLRMVPHIEIFNVSGAGHMVAGDKNDAFNKGTVEFLRRHFPPC